jgi:putative cardiolipin synthase
MEQWLAEITRKVALVIEALAMASGRRWLSGQRRFMRSSGRTFFASVCLASLGLLVGCAGLPSLEGRVASYAGEPDASTPLGRSITPLVRANPGKTGVLAIGDGRLAFGTRMHLARNAARSIDIQTYIWHADTAGTLLFEEVARAAERGVRVRLLLDDANTTGLDPTLMFLAGQPNIEVRLYNPFVNRGSRAIGMLTDFKRLNHRMHNKSFTVDNLAAVVGGRNIADEYFETGQEKGLVDLDVLAVGEVVRSVSAEFDLFWNSASAYPARLLLADVAPQDRQALARRAQEIAASPQYEKYAAAIRSTPQVSSLLEGTLRLEWTTARVVHDDPGKTLAPSTDVDLQLLPKLEAAFGSPTATLDMISPYFVPGESGTEALVALARRGVRVRVLTNSLAATDVSSVHAGYAKRRKALLDGGVRLFELKPEAANIKRHAREVGSSATAGLHAKTYAVDGRAIFVGSFNLDPRSSKLNTEMGLIIDSPTLAGQLSKVLDQAFPSLAYRVTLGDDGSLRWADGTTENIDVEPETGWFQRALMHVESWLPGEWLL